MKTVIFSRNTDDFELKIASQFFPIINSLDQIEEKDLVIARYSAEPFYQELEQEIIDRKAELINTFEQHQYLSNLKLWYQDLWNLTPETWFSWEDIPAHAGELIVKGNTYSKKHHWNELMFANDKNRALEISHHLHQDPIMHSQELCFRKFVPLQTFKVLNSGLPITKEFRFFVAYQEIVGSGFYWSEHLNDLEVKPNLDDVPLPFLQRIIKRIGNKANFYTADIAQCQDDSWIVIELNEGQMAGLSCINPETFYANLKDRMDDLC